MYQKEIIYMGLYKDGGRLGSAGFLKVENRDRESRLSMKVQNLPYGISGRFPIRVYNGNDWKEINGITIQDGGGKWEDNLAENVDRAMIQVMLAGGYVLEGKSKSANEVPMRRNAEASGNMEISNDAGRQSERNVLNDIDKKENMYVGIQDGRIIQDDRQGRFIQSSMDTQEGGSIQNDRGIEDNREEQNVRNMQNDRGIEDNREKQNVRNMQNSRGIEDNREEQNVRNMQNSRGIEDSREEQNVKNMQNSQGIEDNREEQKIRNIQSDRGIQDNRDIQNVRNVQNDRGIEDNRDTKNVRNLQNNRDIRDSGDAQNVRNLQNDRSIQNNRGMQDNRGIQNTTNAQNNGDIQDGRGIQDSGNIQRNKEMQSNTTIPRNANITNNMNTRNNTTSQRRDTISVLPINTMDNTSRRSHTDTTRSSRKSPQTIIITEEMPRSAREKSAVMPYNLADYNLKEDKWEQILDTFEQIHPYGDERVYVKLEPKDFVILQANYQHLVNNSFLLHGFYNYRYVILGKEEDYYLGVPGVFYEREKMVALMFGFEAFECPGGAARAGEFGYYLRKVEL